MPAYPIVDAFPAFLAFWRRACGRPLEEQIELWAAEYLAPWPELLAKQLDDYAADGLDWRQIARERIFPALPGRLEAMAEAHGNLLACWEPACRRVRQRLGFESDVVGVVYVGIGVGAGWATRYQGMPAVLFGLENIAECGWSDAKAIPGLIAHELGHLVHRHWRGEAGQQEGSGPFWQLYEEGFAQRCEDIIEGRESWHEGTGGDRAWLAWCREHQGWLAAEFLRRAEAGEDIRVFFGSWFEIEGHSQCGYYLGHELVKALEAELGLRATASLGLGEIEARLKAALMALAGA